MRMVRGFTLVELLVTIAVIAIVLGIALPSFQAQILNNRSVALSEDIVAAFNLARSEAVKRGTRVSICASNNANDNLPTCQGQWTDGFIVFVDTAISDATAAPVVGTVLQVWTRRDAGAVITATTEGNPPVTFVRFTGIGTMARIPNVTEQSVNIAASMQRCTGNSARNITVGLSGMISVARIACSST